MKLTSVNCVLDWLPVLALCACTLFLILVSFIPVLIKIVYVYARRLILKKILKEREYHQILLTRVKYEHLKDLRGLRYQQQRCILENETNHQVKINELKSFNEQNLTDLKHHHQQFLSGIKTIHQKEIHNMKMIHEQEIEEKVTIVKHQGQQIRCMVKIIDGFDGEQH